MHCSKGRFSACTWIFAAVIFINLYYCYLIDSEEDINLLLVNISPRAYALLFALAWGGLNFVKLLKYPEPEYKYGKWMIAMLALIVLSAIQSFFLHEQSILLGIYEQRIVLAWTLLYFPIRKCLYYGKLKYQKIIKIFVVLCVIQLTIFISQYFLRDSIAFTYVGEGMRNGRIRYYYSPVLLDLMYLFSLDYFARAKGIRRFLGAGLAGAVLFEVMVVQQFRLSSMGLILTLGLFVLLLRGKVYYKMVYFVIGAFALGVLFTTPLVQNVLNTVLHNDYDSGMQIRFVGKGLYMETLARHPVLGGGFPSIKCAASYYASGWSRRIYLSDNGVFAFAYLYGGLGIIWVVSLWAKLLRSGTIIRKKTSELTFLLYPMFFIITCINELHWYWEYGPVIFVIFLCLAEEKRRMADSYVWRKVWKIGGQSGKIC